MLSRETSTVSIRSAPVVIATALLSRRANSSGSKKDFVKSRRSFPDSGPLTRSAAEKVGQIVAALRNGFVAWYEGNKEIAITAQKLASVTLATCALHMFGASTEL